MRALELRKDIELKDLRRAAKVEKDSGLCRRLLGICHLLETGDLSGSRAISCLTAVPFYYWVKRFNAEGIEGLRRRRGAGRPLKMSVEVEKELQAKVLEGPKAEESLVRYRLVDLQTFLKEEHKIEGSISWIWRRLQRMGLSWKTSRQRHPQSDERVQENFKKTF